MCVVLVQIRRPEIIDGAENNPEPIKEEEDELNRKGIAGSADAEYDA